MNDTITENKQAILSYLYTHGIHKVVCEYSGSGDSGQVDCVVAYDSSENKITSKDSLTLQITSREWKDGQYITKHYDKNLTFYEAIEEFVYQWLSDNYGGWENNEGASGTLEIFPGSQQFIFSHTVYEQVSETYNHTL